MSAPAPALAKTDRIVSMDQFRGYTVAGMFLVNFVGGMAAIHAVLKHHNNYFSYADSIMPSFIFAVGFSYRLTILRRLQQLGSYKTYMTYLKRSISLIVVSLMVFSFGNGFKEWKEFDRLPDKYAGPEVDTKADDSAGKDDSKEGKKGRRARREAKEDEKDEKPWYTVEIPKRFLLNWRVFALQVLKANLWEVLAIIGVCQIFIMPVIAAPAWVRFVALIACAVGHTVMAHYFNWDFQNGLDALYRVTQGAEIKYVHGLGGLVDALKTDAFPPPKVLDAVSGLTTSLKLEDGRLVEMVRPGNFMDQLWGLRGKTSWDGGFFGIVSWSVAMLAGTLVYDFMARTLISGKTVATLLITGTVLMVLGYGMSCLTRLYDLEQVPGLPEIAKLEKERDEEIKEVEKKRDEETQKIPKVKPAEERKTDEEKKSEEARVKADEAKVAADAARLKAEAEADIAKIKKEFEAPIAKIQAENKEGADRANKINEGYVDPETGELIEGLAERRETKLAASPVIPPFDRAKGRDWKDLLAEPPFVQPPPGDFGALREGKPARVWNYWMMGKRTVNQSFMLFAIGFAVFLYGLFVVLCDIGSVRVGVFRTFGMNPLAAYVIHEITAHSIGPLIPDDSPVWFCMVGFAIFFAITYILVRGLEKQNIYVRM